jgi:rSAM/selenodomain-associated transferase 1
MSTATLLVIAKAPLPGRAKTRLCPPCTPAQAARLAESSLRDTLDVVAATPATRRVLVFEGDGHAWRPPSFELIPQRGDGLADRLAAAFEDIDGPALLVGMDTPQLTPRLLRDGLDALARPGVDAVLGPAVDGGYWSIGLREPCAAVFAGVPMSAANTCAVQRRRLADLGLAVHEQPTLLDVDTFADARAVAALAPDSRFASTFAAL